MFRFKQFTIHHDRCAMKVGTDGVLLGTWADLSEATSILDIGSGSGLIALICAQRAPHTESIVGVEYEENAFSQSCENVAKSPWSDRVSIVHDRIQEFSSNSAFTFDCIISNPPFFNTGNHAPNKPRGQARHTSMLSHEDLLNAILRLLSPNGAFHVILPRLEGQTLIEEAKHLGLYPSHITEVKGRIHKPVERLLIRFERQKKSQVLDKLVIYNDEGLTAEFTKLVKDFYLKL